MNDSQNWNAVGEQMKSALSDALQTGDFSSLNELVSQTVSDALGEAGKHIAENFSAQQPEKTKPTKSLNSAERPRRSSMSKESAGSRRNMRPAGSARRRNSCSEGPHRRP